MIPYLEIKMSGSNGVYGTVGNYDMPIGGLPYKFSTVVSPLGTVGWTSNDADQRVNLQYDGRPDAINSKPVKASSFESPHAVIMVQHILSSKTKRIVSLEEIMKQHGDLAWQIFKDFKSYSSSAPGYTK